MLNTASKPARFLNRSSYREPATRDTYYHTIFNASFHLMWLLQPDGVLIEANQTALDVAGISDQKQQPAWESPWFSITAFVQERLQQAIRKAGEGNLQRYEEEIGGKENKTALIDLSLRPVIDNQGVISLIIAEGRLLDETRQNELSRQKVERQFRSFMENTPTLTWILDEFACFRYINPGYMKMFQLTEDDVGKSIYSKFPKHICDSYVENNNRVWKAGRPLETIEEGVAPDGSQLVLQIFKFPLDTDNGVRLIGGTALDITQLEQTKAALAKSNERYHYAVKATSDAIWDLEIEKQQIYRGEGFRTLFGHEPGAGSFDEQFEHVHPVDRQKVISGIQKVLSAKKDRWQATYRFRCKDGSYKTVQDKAYILRSNEGKPFRLIGAMQDITVQQKMQKKMLDDESERKREIIAAIIEAQEKERKEISYELHDNVNQVLATCKLFLETAYKDPQAHAELISLCRDNIHEVIEEIRNISRNLTPYALKDIGLVPAISDMIVKINAARHVAIKFSCPDDFNEQEISFDMKTSMYRIIQEQITNILKHAGATKVHIRLNRYTRKISLEVKDNGNGFNVLTLRKGLGLNNIQNRVELHKGKMALFSEPGKGCRLKIELPLIK